jgi:hypothetical protein
MTPAVLAERAPMGMKETVGRNMPAMECHICEEAIDYPLSPVFLDQYYSYLLED